MMVENLVYKKGGVLFIKREAIYEISYVLSSQVLGSKNRRNLDIDLELLVDMFCDRTISFFTHILSDENNICISTNKNDAKDYYAKLFESKFDEFISFWADIIDEYNQSFIVKSLRQF